MSVTWGLIRRARRQNKGKHTLRENTARWSAVTGTVKFREGVN